MEVVLQSQEHLHWQTNLKRFYVIKGTTIFITIVALICTSVIYGRE